MIGVILLLLYFVKQQPAVATPATTGTPVGVALPPTDPQGWFIMPDGYLYRQIREASAAGDNLENIALYERQGDTDHVYMLSADGEHMLGMQP